MTEPEEKLSPEMVEYRATLVQIEQDAQVDCDKAILALSGGGLGVSFAFFRGIWEHSNTAHAGALFWAWICWGLSLAFTLISFYTARCAMRKAINEVDERKSPPHFGGWWDRLTSFCNGVGGILFFAGLVLAMLFLYNNVR